MSNIVNLSEKHKNNAAEIMRLRAMISAVRQQLDLIDQVAAAMMPDHEAASRYQRERAICADRAKTRDYLEGEKTVSRFNSGRILGGMGNEH